MFAAKDYTILNWTKSLDVFGIVMQEKTELFAVTAVTESVVGDGLPLPERLSKSYRDLSPSKDSVVILSGHIDQGVYLELKLPNLKRDDIDQLLRFELARRVPFDVEDLIWSHEPVEGTLDESTGKCTYRIFAVPSENWIRLISELQLSGVKADLFVPVFMSATGKGAYYFPTMNSEFSLSASNEHDIREFVYTFNPSEGIPDISGLIEHNEYYDRVINPRFIPAVLCGAHVIKKGLKAKESLMDLPKPMRPQRHRAVSRAFWFVLLVASVMVASMGARIYHGNSSRMRALQNELDHVSSTLKQHRSDEQKHSHLNGLIEKVKSEELGDHDLIIYLGELTRMLPNSMRLSHFNMKNGIIDISVICDSGSDAVVSAIRTNPRYIVESINETRRLQVTNVNVKLGIADHDR